MLIIPLYLLILSVGVYFIVKALAPELNLKISLPSVNWLQLGRPKLMKDVSTNINNSIISSSKAVEQLVVSAYANANIAAPLQDEGKVELMLAEKNREIALLKSQLQAKQRQGDDFEKLKSILDEEIIKLREQNRILKSEIASLAPARLVKTP